MRWNDVTGISGVVKGTDNQPIEGALIVLGRPSKVPDASAYTDASGRYSIFSMPPGTYEATAFKAGHVYVSKPNIVIEKGESIEVNFTLSRKQSNLSWLERFMAFIIGSNAYAYPPPMPEPQVPFDIQQSCFDLGQGQALIDAVSESMDRIVAATPQQMGPEVKVRIAQKLKEGIKIECEQSKNNRFYMFGSLTNPAEAYASAHIPSGTIHMCPATYTDPLGLQRWGSVLLHETVHASHNAKIGPGWPYKDLSSEKIPYECEKSLYCDVPNSSLMATGYEATGCCCR